MNILPYLSLPRLPELQSASAYPDSARNMDLMRRMRAEDRDQVWESWYLHQYRSQELMRLNSPREFDGWRTNRGFNEALDGLIDYLKVAASSNGPTIQPSKAVDVLWKAWSERSPRTYERFCETFLGKRIPYAPAAGEGQALTTQELDDRISRTWVGLYRQAGAGPSAHAVPPLFNCDKRLAIPGGYAFDSQGGHVSHQRVDNAGGLARQSTVQHAGVNVTRFAELGLVSEQEASREREVHAEQRQAIRSVLGMLGIASGERADRERRLDQRRMAGTSP